MTAAPEHTEIVLPPRRMRWRLGRGAGTIGGVILAVIAIPCFVTLPWSLRSYNEQRVEQGLSLSAPTLSEPMGTDSLGRSLLWRCLLGGAISLGIGMSAALISVAIGVV
jgi:oligopeptide transport system permease protein